MKHDHHQFLVFKDRTAERIPIETSAILRRDGAPDVVVHLSNISAQGFRCCSPERLKIGSAVVLELEGVGELHATVAWQLGGDAGAQFKEEVSWTRIFSALLRTVKPRRGSRR